MLSHLPTTALTIPCDAGYLVLPPGTFPEVSEIVDEARAALSRSDEARPPEGKNRKRFLVNVLDARRLSHESAIVRLALRTDVLAAVSRYLGVVPLLTAVSVFHSDTVDAAPTSSQLHHCDGDDTTQIKIFVHCTDVDDRSGPLTVVEAARSREIRRRTRYQFRQRLTDAQVEEAWGPGADKAITGPAGTVAFVDTSRCFHYGSRVAPDAAPRLVTMIQYQTPYSFMLPRRYQDAVPFRHLLCPDLLPLQRLVLGE